MIHETIIHFSGHGIIIALSLAEYARLLESLTLSCSKENIPAPASIYHSLRHIVVLVLISVLRQLRMIIIHLEMCPHLIAYIF